MRGRCLLLRGYSTKDGFETGVLVELNAVGRVVASRRDSPPAVLLYQRKDSLMENVDGGM
jgi:hypothetical protein